jgi:hypothetical protein
MVKIKIFLLLFITFAFTQYFSTLNSVPLYALATFPGTRLHELAHYTAALVLDGSTGFKTTRILTR